MNNPPAFPVVFEHADCTSEQEGMDLRDYFAAKAMQAFITPQITPFSVPDFLQTADTAYKYADAMLIARIENQ